VRTKDVDWKGDYNACKVIRQTRYTGFPAISAERDAIIAISRYHHPDIVDILDIWTEQEAFGTVFYIQMELCDGDLHAFLQQRYNSGMEMSLSESAIWKIFIQIIAGIEFIHSKGIVHGSLKPQNSILPLPSSL
jgi:serine/threonine protein kinase